MKLEVLVATMHQKDHNLVEKINIQTDAIIINQCDRNEFEEFEYKGSKIKFLSFNERGVGLSRNNALMRATGDICLFADEDVHYVDGYEKIILDAFKYTPKADIIMFNLPSENIYRPTYIIPRKSRVRFFNCLRYGAVKIAVKRERLLQANVFFSLLFGGGAKYSAGEDSLFVAECLRKGLRVYACPNIIGYVSQEDSSWFEGYTEKFFFDKGVFFAYLSKGWAKLLCLQLLLRHKEMWKGEYKLYEAYRMMKKSFVRKKNDKE